MTTPKQDPPNVLKTMDYRREIDGLRALAVLPVILFHAGFETFSGGFVGVDVFFVISGYLITTIILAELEQGNFSIVNFYERRARRILPALFSVMLVCIPFAWFWLLPSNMKDFSQSLVAVSVFASNIFFWRESGYFDTAAELKPLLHTWSLSVEEQYYVLFPLFLMIFWKLGKRWILVTLGLVFVASLAVAQWAAYAKPAAAFYLLPPRGWELLIGAFAAFYLSQANRKDFGKGLSEFGGWLGVALILYAVFAYSKATPFPGFYALVPTLGTVLIILFATKQTAVGKLLGNKAFVGVGLISYSAYLWHQPLFAFARHMALNPPGKIVFFALSVAAVFLGYVSWKYIESPFRSKSNFDRQEIFKISTLAMAFPLAVGLLQLKFDFPTYISLANPEVEVVPFSGGGWSGTECEDFKVLEGDVSCSLIRFGHPRSRVVIWGDSHALALKLFEPKLENVELIVVGHSGCPPLAGVVRFDGVGNSKNCSKYNTLENYLEWINNKNPDVVLLVGRWSLYLEGWIREGSLQMEHHFLKDRSAEWQQIVADKSVRQKVLVDGFKRTLKKIRARDIYIVNQPMDFAEVGYRSMFHESSFSKASLESYNSSRFNLLASIDDVKIIDLSGLFCESLVCFTRDNGQMIYSDDNHLSAWGAKVAWEKLLVPVVVRP